MENAAYKILYIEDQPEMIELVRLALRRMGCEVFGVTDGVQGLKMMREMRPDLVLLDLMLPGWDGWQIRQAMQADAELRDLPVVLVTARVTSPNGPADRVPPPARACVTKPFSLNEIRATIQTILSQRVPVAQAI